MRPRFARVCSSSGCMCRNAAAARRLSVFICPSSGRAVRATPRYPWLVYPARASLRGRSSGSMRLSISSKRHPMSPSPALASQRRDFDWRSGSRSRMTIDPLRPHCYALVPLTDRLIRPYISVRRHAAHACRKFRSNQVLLSATKAVCSCAPHRARAGARRLTSPICFFSCQSSLRIVTTRKGHSESRSVGSLKGDGIDRSSTCS